MSKYINEFPQHLVSPGVPAFNYRVYFGDPNEDPIANYKPVYSDSGLTVVIPQPLILNSDGLYGQEVFLNGEYSIQINTPSTVANPNGVIWQSAPAITGIAGSLNTVSTVAEAKASTNLLDGQGVYILGYYAAADGGGGMYVYDASSAATANDGTVLALDTLAGRLLHGETTAITVKTFGAAGNGIADDLASINNALSLGIKISVPKGVYMLGGRLVAHEGSALVGEGRESEMRFTNAAVATGITMLINSGYDTQGGYTAAGNITISNMTWNDRGDLDTTNGSGSNNALLFAHAKNVHVHDCYFPQHKYHAVDFVGCADSSAYRNTCENGKSSAIQIDQAVAGTNYNVFGDDTPCINVDVMDNNIFSPCYDPDAPQGFVGGIHIHRDAHSHIDIHHNHLQGPFQGVFADPNVTHNHLNIYKNTVLGINRAGASVDINPNHNFGIRLLCAANNSSVYKNTVSDFNKGGIYSGYSVSPLAFTKGFSVEDNDILRCLEDSIFIINHESGLKCRGNTIDLAADNTRGIFIDGADRLVCSDNEITGNGPASECAGIRIENGAVTVITGQANENRVYDCQYAIDIQNGSGFDLFDNTLKNNATPFIIIGPTASVNHERNVKFDSGWVAINAGSEVSSAHNLSIIPTNIELFVSPNSDGSSMRKAVLNTSGATSGVWITEIGISTMLVRAGSAGAIAGISATGIYGVAAANGYFRVKATA